MVEQQVQKLRNTKKMQLHTIDYQYQKESDLSRDVEDQLTRPAPNYNFDPMQAQQIQASDTYVTDFSINKSKTIPRGDDNSVNRK